MGNSARKARNCHSVCVVLMKGQITGVQHVGTAKLCFQKALSFWQLLLTLAGHQCHLGGFKNVPPTEPDTDQCHQNLQGGLDSKILQSGFWCTARLGGHWSRRCGQCVLDLANNPGLPLTPSLSRRHLQS